MYPKRFVPSTFSTVNDGKLNVEADCPTQIWRPLLGLSFNGQQPLILTHKLPNMAAEIIRMVVEVPTASPLLLTPGPATWSTGVVPWSVLSEDPNAEKWWWVDALPWDGSVAGTRLWSVYATKDFVPPPPPPPPPPITMGATAPVAPVLALGTVYQSTLAAGTTGYAYALNATGSPYTVSMLTGAVGTTSTQPMGGNHAAGIINEGVSFTGVGSSSILGGGHLGPDSLIRVTNAALGPVTFTYSLTSP